jgi:hypothetical protein
MGLQAQLHFRDMGLFNRRIIEITIKQYCTDPRTPNLAGCASTLVSITGLAASESVAQNLDEDALEAAFVEFCSNPSVNQLSISAGVLAERLVTASAAALVNVTATTCACKFGLLECEQLNGCVIWNNQSWFSEPFREPKGPGKMLLVLF